MTMLETLKTRYEKVKHRGLHLKCNYAVSFWINQYTPDDAGEKFLKIPIFADADLMFLATSVDYAYMNNENKTDNLGGLFQSHVTGVQEYDFSISFLETDMGQFTQSADMLFNLTHNKNNKLLDGTMRPPAYYCFHVEIKKVKILTDGFIENIGEPNTILCYFKSCATGQLSGGDRVPDEVQFTFQAVDPFMG